MADIGIVGAGLAGLTAGLELTKLGHQVTIYEASDAPGGRVRSNEIDGHIVDAGFQIFIDGYPTASQFLDYESLSLCSFEPGSMIFTDHGATKVGDPFRRPTTLLSTTTSSIGSIADKLRLLKLRASLQRKSPAEIWAQDDLSTIEYLEKLGFSNRFIANFWRPLFSGILLDSDLSGSANTTQFIFKMLGSSNACVPANGMGELTKHLASKLSPSIQLATPVRTVKGTSVETASGLKTFDQVIVATGFDEAIEIAPHKPRCSGWKGCTSVWFSAAKAPTTSKMIHLGTAGPVNNFAVMSNVSESYSPAGKATMVATSPSLSVTEGQMRDTLTEWFGQTVTDWATLDVQSIEKAQPTIEPGQDRELFMTTDAGVVLAGDYLADSSINGAMESGKAAAIEVHESLG